MSDKWDQGYRAALRGTLSQTLQSLGFEGSEAEHAKWIIERERAIAVLREVCEQFGDNEWSNDLNLGDIIDKHLSKHLHNARHPLDKKRRCPNCKKMTRITTAGCDHCDLEDK